MWLLFRVPAAYPLHLLRVERRQRQRVGAVVLAAKVARRVGEPDVEGLPEAHRLDELRARPLEHVGARRALPLVHQQLLGLEHLRLLVRVEDVDHAVLAVVDEQRRLAGGARALQRRQQAAAAREDTVVAHRHDPEGLALLLLPEEVRRELGGLLARALGGDGLVQALAELGGRGRALGGDGAHRGGL
eukprot:2031587-Prymnesium_polylepis.1